MTNRKRRYWAVRTDRSNRAILLDELRQGRLRQGWGYEAGQDLRLIHGEILRGGKWWERLSATQKDVLPHLRMLPSAEDSVQLGDWVVTPNLPEDGMFLVAEVIGEYYYEPLKLTRDTDVNNVGQDYGHVLPVRVLTAKGINRYADAVAADLRGSVRRGRARAGQRRRHKWRRRFDGDLLRPLGPSPCRGEPRPERSRPEAL